MSNRFFLPATNKNIHSTCNSDNIERHSSALDFTRIKGRWRKKLKQAYPCKKRGNKKKYEDKIETMLKVYIMHNSITTNSEEIADALKISRATLFNYKKMVCDVI